METKAKPNWLLIFIKYGLDVLWYISLGFIVIAIIFIVSKMNEPPSTYAVNIKYSGELKETFKPINENIDSIVFQPTEGKLILRGEHVFSKTIWIFIFSLIMFALYLFFLHLLRKLFTSFMHQFPFNPENIKRLRLISLCFVIFNMMMWFWEWYCIPEITKFAPDLTSVSSIRIPEDFAYIFIALVIYIFADVFKYGFELHNENKQFV